MSVELRAGAASAAVDPTAGSRLASLVAGGRDRLITTPDPTSPLPSLSWGSYAMLPWVGRMRDGHLAWRGTEVELPRNFFGHAIHGAGFDRPWDVAAADGRSVELVLRLGPSARWPFGGQARQWHYQLHKYALNNRVIAIDLRGHGLSDKPTTGYDMPRILTDLESTLDVLRVKENFVLVGHSFGGAFVNLGLLTTMKRRGVTPFVTLVNFSGINS